MLTEVRVATLGVSNLDRSIDFYRDALGWRLQDAGDIDPALAALLRFAPHQRGRWAMMAADDSGRGRVRLLALEPPGERLWNENNRYSGSGYYALNFRCRDARASMARIEAAGGHVAHEPSFWEVSEQVAVWDSISDDPDGIRLDLFSYERGGELRGPLETDVSVLQTVAIATRDVARSRRFYEGLGFRELFDRVLDFPELQQLLGADRPVKIHNVNLMKDGHIVPGRVEMFAYLGIDEVPETPLGPLAHPPRLGILAIGFESNALDADLATLASLGARSITRAMVQDWPGYGSAEVAVVAGPDGEAIEVVATSSGVAHSR
jgi:catechol 2,3-dioxygenase-like lactoylglutathione lyase family enzyme